MDCRVPCFPVHHQIPEPTQIHVHWVSDAIQPFQPLLFPSSALSLSQHQGLFQWISSSHQVAKVLEFRLQHQSFQWTFRTDFLLFFFFSFLFFIFLFFIYFFIVVGFVIHWNESALDLHVFPILILPPTSLSTPIPLGLPSAPGPSTCLMHPTWAGDLFHPR